MEFSYSEELLEIKRIVREFAEKEIRPHVMEWDEVSSSQPNMAAPASVTPNM
jgi:hypothetical protein